MSSSFFVARDGGASHRPRRGGCVPHLKMLICLLHLAAGLSAAADYGREKDELGTRNYFISSALTSLGMSSFRNGHVPAILKTPLASRFRHLPILDIGSNAGLDLTIPAARLGHTVYAFEPTSSTFEKLLYNLRKQSVSFSKSGLFEMQQHMQLRNKTSRKASGHVAAFNVAVSNHSGTALFMEDTRGGGISNSLGGRKALPPRTKAVQTTVHLLTLDDVLEFYDEQGIFLLKIDSQGHEYHVLQGALRFIKTHPVYVLLLEFYPKGLLAAGVNPLDLLYMLHRELQYQCFDIGPGAHPTALSLEGFVAAHPPNQRGTWGYGKWTDIICLNFRLI